MRARTIAFLTCAACVAGPGCSRDAGDAAVTSPSAATTVTPLEARFAFASPSPSTEQGAPPNVDVLGIGPWVLDTWTPSHDAALAKVRAMNKVPFVYLYIAAGRARSLAGLQDCNVGAAPDKTLCHGGAAFLRAHLRDVVSAYAEAAAAIAVGDPPAIVHIEPDWFQYSSPDQTEPLTHDESTSMMNAIVRAVSDGCASCKIAIDVSPWCDDLAAYYAGWDLSVVTYAALVGKYLPATTSPIDKNTYARIHAVTGKPVIVSSAYGPGGAPTAYGRDWDDRATLETLAGAGVAMVMQSNTDRAHYTDVIAQYASHPIPIPTGAGWRFTRSPNVNADWVEVAIAGPAGAEITKVEAIVEGETWHELLLQPWGGWAASFHVASRTHVVFRAWDGAGAPHDSTAFVWP